MCEGPQKVVIPKGLINPQKVTIIEIPNNLQDPIVIAMPRINFQPCRPSYYQPPNQVMQVREATPSPVRSFSGSERDTYVSTEPSSNNPCPQKKRPPPRPKSHPRTKFPTRQPDDDKCLTFGGYPYDSPSWEFKIRKYPKMGRKLGRVDTPETEFRKFDPPRYSSFQDIDDSYEPMYRDFRRVGATCTPPNRHQAGHRPPSLKSVHDSSFYSEGGTHHCGHTEDEPEESCYEYEEGGGYEYEDQSYYYEDQPSSTSVRRETSYEYEGGDEYSEPCPPEAPQAQAYVNPNHSDLDLYGDYCRGGSHSQCGSPVASPCGMQNRSSRSTPEFQASPEEVSKDEILCSVSNVDRCETEKILMGLSNYQAARRKLIFDTVSMATAGEISAQLTKKC